MSVKEELQHCGIGTRRLDMLVDFVKEREGKHIYVVTKQAKGFYKKYGFKEVNKIPETSLRCLTCERFKKTCSPTFLKLIIEN